MMRTIKRVVLALALAQLAAAPLPARAGISCYPVEAGGSADYLQPIYVGGIRAFAFVWRCGATWSWVAMRVTGPDVIWGPDAISALATLRMIDALHKAETAFMLAEVGPFLPIPHD